MIRRFGPCAILIALVVITFWPAFGAEFVAWDDDKNFLANPHYRGLSFEHLSWMFTTFHMGPYQPLAWLTLGVDHALYGMEPGGYHVTNVAWHALAVVLFYFLAKALFESARPRWGERAHILCGFVAAALFGVHPLRVESVAWVTERRDVVSGAFFVATALAWVIHARSTERRGRMYALAIALFALALLSKASAVTLPIALLLLDVWPLGRWTRERRRMLLDKLPLVALAIVFAIVAIAGQRSTGTALRALEDHGLGRRIAQSAYAAWFHASRTIWPADLSPIYDMPSPFVASEARFVLAIAFVVLVSVILWLARRRVPVATTAWFAFLVLLAPVSGLVSTGPQLVADRYSYLACMPFALAAAGGFGLAALTPKWHVLAMSLALVAIVALTACARRQTTYWHDSTSLWERAYAVDPHSAVACDHLGIVRVEQSREPGLDTAARRRRLEEAMTLYTHAYELSPHPNQVFNMGGVLMEFAQLDPAKREQELDLAAQTFANGIEFAEKTTGIQPHWRVMYATALVELKRYSQAKEQLALALRDAPRSIVALRYSARVAREENRGEDCLAFLRRAIEADPRDPGSYAILVAQLRAFGRTAEAAAVEIEARDAVGGGAR